MGENDLPSGLTWKEATNTLTMKNYKGGYIKGNFNITIKVEGKDNKITVNNAGVSTSALNFHTFSIEGTDKEKDILAINITGSVTKAVQRYLTIKNVRLEIEADSSDSSNPIYGVFDNTTIDGGHLEVKVNKSETSQKDTYGISGSLTLKNGGTANIEVTGAAGTTKISTHKDAPWISSASKVAAVYTAGDGVSAEKPLTMTVTVPTEVDKITSIENGESNNIKVEGNGFVTLYAAKEDGTLGDEAQEINLTTNDTTFYAKTSADKWFKITVIKE